MEESGLNFKAIIMIGVVMIAFIIGLIWFLRANRKDKKILEENLNKSESPQRVRRRSDSTEDPGQERL
ncbi:hypothetical protein [Pollutibacter soli]|uniref:hypothetical protein n=1 Tax=Pollutibacter soli TaxID=3034157 RepID=UPI0030135630